MIKTSLFIGILILNPMPLWALDAQPGSVQENESYTQRLQEREIAKQALQKDQVHASQQTPISGHPTQAPDPVSASTFTPTPVSIPTASTLTSEKQVAITATNAQSPIVNAAPLEPITQALLSPAAPAEATRKSVSTIAEKKPELSGEGAAHPVSVSSGVETIPPALALSKADPISSSGASIVPSQIELLRRERIRAEIKNEDVLMERLEEMRLQDEANRMKKLGRLSTSDESKSSLP
jgi:hypothetical protein